MTGVIPAGIHFGITNSTIAKYLRKEGAVIIQKDGKGPLRNVVSYEKDTEFPLIGMEAGAQEGRCSISRLKEFVGRTSSAPTALQAARQVNVERNSRHSMVINTAQLFPIFPLEYDGQVSEEHVTTDNVLDHILGDLAGRCHDSKLRVAALDVPEFWDPDTHAALMDSVQKAGFIVLRLLPQSIAALCAYSLNRITPDEMNRLEGGRFVMTVVIGGNTATFSVCRVTPEHVSILATVIHHSLGGAAIDELLQKHRKAENLPKLSQTELEQIKPEISQFGKSKEFPEELVEVIFESYLRTVVSRALETVDDAVCRGKVTDIIFAGGTTRFDIIRDLIVERVFRGEVTVHDSIPGEEVLAVGCANEAAWIVQQNQEKENVRVEYCKLGTQTRIDHLSSTVEMRTIVGEETSDFEPLYSRISPIPMRRTLRFDVEFQQPEIEDTKRKISTVKGADEKVTKTNSFGCAFYETETEDPTEDSEIRLVLGNVELEDLPNKCTLYLKFSITSNGTATFTLEEASSNRTDDLVIMRLAQNETSLMLDDSKNSDSSEDENETTESESFSKLTSELKAP